MMKCCVLLIIIVIILFTIIFLNFYLYINLDEEPRVVELKDEKEEVEVKPVKKSSACAAVPEKKTNVNEID